VRSSGQVERWQRFDSVLQTFVGQTDSMTFAQLDSLLTQAQLSSPADVKELATLERLQADIRAVKIGLPKVAGDVFNSPAGSKKVQMPYSFTVLGQKFVVDSWALSCLVYDDILWN